jgi:hypothetical protein
MRMMWSVYEVKTADNVYRILVVRSRGKRRRERPRLTLEDIKINFKETAL